MQADELHVVCRAFADAVRWCAALQHALLQLNWPAAVLSWPECAEQRSPHTGALLWRGLRMRIGLAYGRPQYRKPLNTGELLMPSRVKPHPRHSCQDPSAAMPTGLKASMHLDVGQN